VDWPRAFVGGVTGIQDPRLRHPKGADLPGAWFIRSEWRKAAFIPMNEILPFRFTQAICSKCFALNRRLIQSEGFRHSLDRMRAKFRGTGSGRLISKASRNHPGDFKAANQTANRFDNIRQYMSYEIGGARVRFALRETLPRERSQSV
jgi:hypothetical protein